MIWRNLTKPPKRPTNHNHRALQVKRGVFNHVLFRLVGKAIRFNRQVALELTGQGLFIFTP